MLLSALCYFQPYVTSNLVVLPAPWYFQSHGTTGLVLLSASYYFQPYVTSNLVVLPAIWYYKPHITFNVVLLPVSCYFQSRYFQPHVTFSNFGPNILLSALSQMSSKPTICCNRCTKQIYEQTKTECRRLVASLRLQPARVQTQVCRRIAANRASIAQSVLAELSRLFCLRAVD